MGKRKGEGKEKRRRREGRGDQDSKRLKRLPYVTFNITKNCEAAECPQLLQIYLIFFLFIASFSVVSKPGPRQDTALQDSGLCGFPSIGKLHPLNTKTPIVRAPAEQQRFEMHPLPVHRPGEK